MSGDLDPTFVVSNRIEAGFWMLIGMVCAVRSLRLSGQAKRDAVVAAVTFFAFGGSDIVESMTGAWWRPWWLLMWKAACLAVLLWLLIRHVRRRRTIAK